MTSEEKAKFINNLVAAVITPIMQGIQTGKIPARWEGPELRAYLAHQFNQANSVRMENKRFDDYRNDIIINQL